MILVVKIGTSSLTDNAGSLQRSQISRLIKELAAASKEGHKVVLVTSGAIAAGKAALDLKNRPKDYASLRALSAVGQSRLQGMYEEELSLHKLVGGQVLLTLEDFASREHYLSVRETLQKLLEQGVIPIVNENDAVTDAEIRFGDNDRLAAMVAHLLKADLLVLLTDTEGLFTADPASDESATLVQEILEVDRELEQAAGDTNSESSSGGMASKLASARIAAWSGIRSVIASAFKENVISDILAEKSVGTVFLPKKNRLSARKLWIGFAAQPKGSICIDEGARRAILEQGKSLLPVGVTQVSGSFEVGEAVEVLDSRQKVCAKGIVSISSKDLSQQLDKKEAGFERSKELMHRDDLIILGS